MERLRQYKVPLGTVFGAVLLVIIVYVAWISPEGTKLSSLNAQKTKLHAQEMALQAQLTRLKHEKASLGTTCATLVKDVTQVPEAPEVDSFLHQVTSLAVNSGDPNTPSIGVNSAGSTSASSGVTPVAVSFTLAGTFGQMSTFLQGLYTFPRLFTISSVTIGGGPVVNAGAAPSAGTPNYTLTLSGNIYYASVQADVCSVSK